MIELNKIEGDDSVDQGGVFGDYVLLVDGIPVPEGQFQATMVNFAMSNLNQAPDKWSYLQILNKGVGDSVLGRRPDEIITPGTNRYSLFFRLGSSEDIKYTSLSCSCSKGVDDNTPSNDSYVTLYIVCDYFHWDLPWSIASYLPEMVSQIENNSPALSTVESRTEPEYESSSIALSIPINSHQTFGEGLNTLVEVAVKAHEATFTSLRAKQQSGTVSLHFDFPDAVKVPCEQYLLYFAQFLKDVGIGATANIQHEAGQVLFTVTPDNPDQALDKIREALAVYLRLPTAPAGSLLPTAADPIEVQRMGANLQFMQGQLMLANALTMSQQTTIQNLQGIISQQQTAMSCMVDGSIFLQALEMAYIAGSKGDQKPNKDVEAILGNTVEITKLELKNFGVNVNLPVIYRALKNLLIESDPPTPPTNGLTD